MTRRQHIQPGNAALDLDDSELNQLDESAVTETTRGVSSVTTHQFDIVDTTDDTNLDITNDSNLSQLDESAVTDTIRGLSSVTTHQFDIMGTTDDWPTYHTISIRNPIDNQYICPGACLRTRQS